MRSPLAITFQYVTVIAAIAGVYFFFTNETLYGVACIIDALFTYGFAYLIEAASIYIEKDRKERKKTYQY